MKKQDKDITFIILGVLTIVSILILSLVGGAFSNSEDRFICIISMLSLSVLFYVAYKISNKSK